MHARTHALIAGIHDRLDAVETEDNET
jgi:hypothetical protein